MSYKQSYQEMFTVAAENFAKAAELNNLEIYQAVLVNTLNALPSWLENLEKSLGKVNA